MTQTTNFNLSQWEKSDRIQMADFNADNAKIDAALVSAVPQTIFDETTAADGNFTRYLGLDWSQWREIHIEVLPAAGSGASTGFYVTYNNDPFDRLTTMDSAYNHLVGFPAGNPDAPLVFLVVKSGGGSFERAKTVTGSGTYYTTSYYNRFNYLSVRAYGAPDGTAVKAGTRVRMWGCKM